MKLGVVLISILTTSVIKKNVSSKYIKKKVSHTKDIKHEITHIFVDTGENIAFTNV